MNRPPIQLLPFLRGTAIRRGALFGGILLGALLAFEVFNYSTTDFALHDVLGDLRFAGLRWSTILSLAFCGIDFAGIALYPDLVTNIFAISSESSSCYYFDSESL